VKTKPRSHVQVVQKGNDEVIMRDDIFQIDKLVGTYRVALFTKKFKFSCSENIFVNVDVEELNDILRTNEHTKVDKDDDIDEL
jgi:hypothetical protein